MSVDASNESLSITRVGLAGAAAAATFFALCWAGSFLPIGTVIGPVGGMQGDPAASQHRQVVDGVTWHFCSEHCAAKFAADPAAYLKPPETAAKSAASGTIWTCPMHPQIRRDGPGTCPICG